VQRIKALPACGLLDRVLDPVPTKRRKCDKKGGETMIRKLAPGKYRLFSRKKDARTGKRRNLGTFATRAAAERHERAVQFFKRH